MAAVETCFYNDCLHADENCRVKTFITNVMIYIPRQILYGRLNQER